MKMQTPAVLLLLLLAAPIGVAAQSATPQPSPQTNSNLDAAKEKRALQRLIGVVEKNIITAAEAMPADKYGFRPVEGEFKDVRMFGQQLKHLAATNYILAAAALGEEPPPEAGDEQGPETARTKDDIVEYLKGSFAAIHKAADAIDDAGRPVKSSPISPLQGSSPTRIALVAEALIHANDHYGQMVEYLRMNGVVPPASRR